MSLPRSRARCPFDPDFDDTGWTVEWAGVPVAGVPVGAAGGGCVVVERMLTEAEIFGRTYRAAEPFPVRGLFDAGGRLWMSDTPQERMMMYNNARVSRGHVLVGGLGLALYPQYAASNAGAFTIVERSQDVVDMAGPTLRRALAGRPQPIPCRFVTQDVETFLRQPPATRYDTVFLDTWDTLDALRLPEVNRLRDLAIRHLAPGGRVLLWGYRWMVHLFEDACRQLLAVPPAERAAWLARSSQPRAAALLGPVLEHFAGQAVRDLPGALAWCREYVVQVTGTL